MIDFEDYDAQGSLKYSPNISAEKVQDTTTNSFFQLCRTAEGRKIADKIINNYTKDGQTSSKQLSRRNSIPKAETRKKLSRIGTEVDEN